MTRVALALAASLALTVAANATDLPTGTWAVNVDDNKGDLVIKGVKDGKVTGVLLGTDFTGTWNGKELRFESGGHVFDAQLVREPGEKGLTKYTLTGTRSTVLDVSNRARAGVHVVKAGGWYAQLSAEAPAPTGEIKAEFRGVLVVEGATAYVLVKRKLDSEVEETRVWVNATDGEWKKLAETLAPLNGKEVVVTAALGQAKSKKDGGGTVPSRGLYFVGKLDIKLANSK